MKGSCLGFDKISLVPGEGRLSAHQDKTTHENTEHGSTRFTNICCHYLLSLFCLSFHLALLLLKMKLHLQVHSYILMEQTEGRIGHSEQTSQWCMQISIESLQILRLKSILVFMLIIFIFFISVTY